jgi:hypothetical protein
MGGLIGAHSPEKILHFLQQADDDGISDDPADTSRQRGHGPSGENLFPEKNPAVRP